MIGKMMAIVSGIESATTAPGRKPRLTTLTGDDHEVDDNRTVFEGSIEGLKLMALTPEDEPFALSAKLGHPR